MIEVYFPDEDVTKFVPLEGDNYDVLTLVNGIEESLEYKIKEDDIVTFIIQQHDGSTESIIGWIGVGVAVLGAIALGVASFGSLSPLAAAALGGLGTLAIGVGAGMATAGFLADKALERQKDRKYEGGEESTGLYSINGGSNESIIGHNYPFVLGKHLINPYLIGSPYHETYNSGYNVVTSFSMYSKPALGWGSFPKIEIVPIYSKDMKTDHKDLGQYYTALYCAGYGPLKLTDFRIGDTKLAYNRPFNSSGMERLVNELYELQSGGSVDLTKRPIIPSNMMHESGYGTDNNSYSTLYSHLYPNTGSGYDKFIIVTPIVVDNVTGEFKRILNAQTEFFQECQKIYNSIQPDGSFNDPLGIVIGKVHWVRDYGSEQEAINKLNELAERIHYVQDIYTRRFIASTTMHGILTGVNEEFDGGDILNKWKNNDVQLEIIQAGDVSATGNKWSSLYPVTVKEDSIDATILAVHDKTIKSNADVIYKGISVPCGYRTNTVRFSKSCPYRLEVELDAPRGTFETYTYTDEDSGITTTYYKPVPLFFAVQWRYASNNEASSDAESPDGWNTFDYEFLRQVGSDGKKYPKVYSDIIRQQEISVNKGMSPGTLADNNSKWLGSQVFELSPDICSGEYKYDITSFTDEDVLRDLKEKGFIDYTFEKHQCYRKYPVNVSYGLKYENGVNVSFMSYWGAWYTYDYEIREGSKDGYGTGLFHQDIFYDDNHKPGQVNNFEGYEWSQYVRSFDIVKITPGHRWDDNCEIQYSTITQLDSNGNEYTLSFPSALKYRVVEPGTISAYKKDDYNVNERRYVFVKEFTPAEVQKLIDINGNRSEVFDSVEVRVIRLTPCYLNEVDSKQKYYSPSSYEDLIKWTYLRTWTFDKDEYTNVINDYAKKGLDYSQIKPNDYPQRPIPREDLNKFCYIALRLKQDVAETGGQSLEKLNCIATAMQPNYDMIEHKWVPTINPADNTLNQIVIHEKYSYYFTNYDSNEKKSYIKLPISNYSNNQLERDLFNKLGFNNISAQFMYDAKSQYEYGIAQAEYSEFFFKKRDGNDYYEQIKLNFFNSTIGAVSVNTYPYNNPILSNVVPKCYLPSGLELQFDTQNSASAAISALVGNHLKNEAKTLDVVEIDKFSEMYEFCNDVVDGSLQTYSSPYLRPRTYQAKLNESFNRAYNIIASKYPREFDVLKNAPVNAVWRGCYDYAVNRLLILAGYTQYYKDDFIKFLETKNCFAPADGKLHIQYKCNGVITSQIKMEQLFTDILVTGRCGYRRSENNKYEPLISRAGQYPVTVINQRNCISKNNTRNLEETIAGFNVTYVDENDNYESNNIYVMDDGETEKAPTKRIDAFQLKYVTDPIQMRSLCRFNLAARLYQREVYSRTIGKLGYALSLGDVVLLQDDTLLIGTDKGGRIKELLINEAENTLVGFISDEPFKFTNELDKDNLPAFGCTVVQSDKYGQSRCVTIRCANSGKKVTSSKRSVIYEEGKVYYEYVNNKLIKASPQPQSTLDLSKKRYFEDVTEYEMKEGTTNLFVFHNPIFLDTEVSDDSTIDGLFYTYHPSVDDLLAFGKVGSITSKAVIMSIKPKDKGNFELTLSPYNEKLYEYGERIPLFKGNITTPHRDESDFRFTEYPTTADREEEKSAIQNSIAAITETVIKRTQAPDPFRISAIARKDNILINFEDVNGELNNEISVYYVEVLKPVVVTSSDGEHFYNESGIEVTILDGIVPEKIQGTENYYYTWIIHEPTVHKFEAYSRSTVYNFNRVYDGYPEYDELNRWKIRAKGKNVFGKVSESYNVYSVKTDGYGTWKIRDLTSENVSVDIVDRTVTLKMSAPQSPSRELYGDIRFKVSIKRIGISAGKEAERALTYKEGTVYYNKTPDGYVLADPQPTSTEEVAAGEFYTLYEYPVIQPDTQWFKPDLISSPLANENNYKTLETPAYEISGGRYSQTLPLVGQDEKYNKATVYDSNEIYYVIQDDLYVSADPQPNSQEELNAGDYYIKEKRYIANTIYQYKISAFNESGYETNVTAETELIRTVTALCTSLRDIVKAHAQYKDLYVENLSAINANMGLISQGGFGDFSHWTNFWALSEMLPEDTNLKEIVKQGAFRVGNEEQYIAVVPAHSHFGTPGEEGYIENDTDELKVFIKAGDISLTSDGAELGGGTFVYNLNRTKRMEMQHNGFEIQELTDENRWDTKARIIADTDGNMIITNTGKGDDDKLPEQGIEVNPDTNCIYHFDFSNRDTSSGNIAALNFDQPIIYEEGGVVSGSKALINSSFGTSVDTGDGDICLFNDSDTVMIGNKYINIEDSSVHDEMDYWNERLGVNKFKWGSK